MERQTSKESILLASLELFAEKGFNGVGINEITQKAGITKPSLYYFFGSKDGLFTALLERYFEILNTSVKKASSYKALPDEYEEDVYATLKNVVLAFFNFAQNNRLFYQLILAVTSAPPFSDASRLSAIFIADQRRILHEMFVTISAVHTNIQNKETYLTWSFIAIVNAAIDLWLNGENELTEDLAHTIVHQFMHGIYA